MSDMLTHLKHFPQSSCDSQIAIFTFLNDMLANTEQKGKLRPTESDMSVVFSAYGFVLFGSEFKLDPLNRLALHTHFIDRVNVGGALTTGNSGGNCSLDDVTIDISFNGYCKVIREWLVVLKASLSRSDESASLLDNEWIWELQAGIIQKFLENRRHTSDHCENSIVVQDTHLTDVQELHGILRYMDIRILKGISWLITITARRLQFATKANISLTYLPSSSIMTWMNVPNFHDFLLLTYLFPILC